ncbi:NPCBM/NEW2 domain-containing protein [Actinosynnema sp. NPDC023658]|uniref:NPCBM/NEW2 domain-containing protein n=1 Tax=Actinosynnema sp. NPDC023658 TaxID=3155465 RepID=UPI0034094E21
MAVLAFLANIDGTVGFFERLLGSGEDSRTSAPDGGQVAGPGPLDTTTSSPATAPRVEKTTQSAELPPAATTIVEQPQTSGNAPAPRSVEGWYNLTAYRTLGGGNGFYFVNSIDIGSASYSDSIRASYSSSTADPNNHQTWQSGGKCTRFSAWVGKDAASSSSTGTGRFVIKAEDVEIASAEATMATAAQHIDIDITGVVRLTLFDTRGGRDADNAWGTPRVYCTAPPGKAR